MPDLDALDLALLTALRENPRAGALALSRLTHVARATVESRLSRLERSELPFAAVGRPEDLFDDPHLLASGGLAATRLPDGSVTQLPILPIELDGQRPAASGKLARPGEDTRSVLRNLGLGVEDLEALLRRGVIAEG